MNKFVYFMAVGLAFTVLQVATVEADMIPGTDCAATPGGPDAVAACWDAQAEMQGDHTGMSIISRRTRYTTTVSGSVRSTSDQSGRSILSLT